MYFIYSDRHFVRMKLHKQIKYPLVHYAKNRFPIRTILFANARDEPRIHEWAVHHLLLGFTTIVIFDHKSVIPVKNAFANLDPPLRSRIVVKPCTLESAIKMPLMTEAVVMAAQNQYDWMLYLDADEFLALNEPFQQVQELLQRFHSFHALAINWLMFGSNHHVQEPSHGLMVEHYTRSDAALNPHVKSFVRPQEVIRVACPHHYIIRHPERFVSVDYKIMSPYTSQMSFNPTDTKPDQVHAFVAHYYYQSEETFQKRKQRNRDDVNAPFSMHYRDSIHGEHNECETVLLKNKYASKIRAVLKMEKPCIT